MKIQWNAKAWLDKSGLIALFALIVVVLVFGGIVGIASFRLRAELRERVLQRHAEIWNLVSRFQVAKSLEDELFEGLDLETTIMYSLLEAQDIEGSLGIQLFDDEGRFISGVPVGVDEVDIDPKRVETLKASGPWGHFEPEQESDGWPGETDPVVELLLPILGDNGEVTVIARFLMDGQLIEEEFLSIDQKLAKQAGWAFAGGSLIVSAVFLLAFRLLRNANRELEMRAKRLSEANTELAMLARTSAIGAVASHLIHGLKNPLAGLSQHIASGGQGLEREDWSDASEATKRMQSMINEVVDVLRNEDFDDEDELSIGELGLYLERKFRDTGQSKGVNLTVSAGGSEALPVRVANIAKLIVSNLVDNAIDATPSGGEVCAKIEGSCESINFAVLDSGPGFSETAIERLFSPCQSAKQNGAGIGLAISKQLARHIGAELTLAKSSSSGSEMRLKVPLIN